jgi:hypothetical protein
MLSNPLRLVVVQFPNCTTPETRESSEELIQNRETYMFKSGRVAVTPTCRSGSPRQFARFLPIGIARQSLARHQSNHHR